MVTDDAGKPVLVVELDELDLAARPRNTAGCCGYDGMSIQPTEPTGEQDLPSL